MSPRNDYTVFSWILECIHKNNIEVFHNVFNIPLNICCLFIKYAMNFLQLRLQKFFLLGMHIIARA